MTPRPPSHPRGAALLLVLWAIAAVSFVVVWLAGLVDIELESGASDAAGFKARNIALSGVAIGLHPQVKRDDTDLLEQEFEDGSRLQVRIRGEGARLNINLLLARQDRVTLKNLFALWGVSNDDADVLIDRLTDYVDNDIGRQLNGAEEAEYLAAGIPDAPANRPFRSVDEMGRVLGMELLDEAHPSWREAFTIFGDGKVDVNEASADVLRAAAGLTAEMADGILRQRAGPDGVEPSEDDFRFEDIKQLEGWLRTSSLPPDQVAGRLTVESSVKRIDSRGFVGDFERQISVIAGTSQGGKPADYLLWEEK